MGRGGVRLLLITNMYPGVRNPAFGVFVQRQVEALRELGCEVVLVANSEDRSGWRNAIKYSSLFARTRTAARRRDFDAVVAHFLYPTAAFARVAAVASGRPYVCVAHGTDVMSLASRHDRLARDSRSALDGAARVVAVSRALERRIRDELALAGGVPTVVIHMGVDTRLFTPDTQARSRLSWPPEAKVALFAGNLVPVKGPDIALEAFIELYTTGALDRLVYVGSGSMQPELERRAAEMGVGDAVVFAGRLAADGVATHMAAADVLVMPSRNEGLGLVALEALACGTPVVAARVGGVPEVTPEPPCARLVAPEDPRALALGIMGVMSDASRLEPSLAERCRAAALPHDVREQARAFLGMLEEVVAR